MLAGVMGSLCYSIARRLYYRVKQTRKILLHKGARAICFDHVMPEVGVFFIETVTGTSAGYQRRLKSILGELPITSKQAQKLEVRSNTQLSPYLEICCLRVSANVSYEDAASDIEYFTGVQVSLSLSTEIGTSPEL